MEYRTITYQDYEPIRLFLSESGWQHRVGDPKRFTTLLNNTSRAIVAVEGSRIVGFGRALCDEVSNGYISMLAVAPERRGQGIGRELVRRLTDGDAITWVLRAGRNSDGFWEKIGFQRSDIAMERVRLK